MQGIKNHFSSTLIDWFSKAKRDLPWRSNKDPYQVWLSEIILQQTRVEQGLPYYQRFIETHPTVHSLAESKEIEVLKLWEGLGYYSRARNLHASAKYVSLELDGSFPNSYSELIKLKGVGPYTAAAIASIAFGEARPVVDGNVFRFASRYFGIDADISKASTRNVFVGLLNEFIPEDNPGDFNQAMMEFGAKVCTPSPKCNLCPFAQGCFAFKNNKQNQFPVKSQKVKVEEVSLEYLIIKNENKYLLHDRKNGIWKGLYQFYLIKNDETGSLDELVDLNVSFKSRKIKHLLTHRKLWVSFTHVDVDNPKTFRKIAQELNLMVFSKEEMLTLPKPKVIVNYLEQLLD